jgi:hypothetical protein
MYTVLKLRYPDKHRETLYYVAEDNRYTLYAFINGKPTIVNKQYVISKGVPQSVVDHIFKELRLSSYQIPVPIAWGEQLLQQLGYSYLSRQAMEEAIKKYGRPNMNNLWWLVDTQYIEFASPYIETTNAHPEPEHLNILLSERKHFPIEIIPTYASIDIIRCENDQLPNWDTIKGLIATKNILLRTVYTIIARELEYARFTHIVSIGEIKNFFATRIFNITFFADAANNLYGVNMPNITFRNVKNLTSLARHKQRPLSDLQKTIIFGTISNNLEHLIHNFLSQKELEQLFIETMQQKARQHDNILEDEETITL